MERNPKMRIACGREHSSRLEMILQPKKLLFYFLVGYVAWVSNPFFFFCTIDWRLDGFAHGAHSPL
ncbi:hypothetical protein BO71DRAFT_170083 [Aspergillus ellipticus CBS 707.79]|uniref:Uncharacterized protein n=1 Tax=Aspergillus ellipticus CBS 707.79 TaxID=1448320 RepID=A0A319F3U1_9EURO|nr:hypothetical protein BO71DRAFT_170083 [Aspergillus ellipticus CBS 707.79]